MSRSLPSRPASGAASGPAFAAAERAALLALKGVGPTVVQRLEQLGYTSLALLAQADLNQLLGEAASLVGSTCWKNSPQARAAIQAAIELARREAAGS